MKDYFLSVEFLLNFQVVYLVVSIIFHVGIQTAVNQKQIRDSDEKTERLLQEIKRALSK